MGGRVPPPDERSVVCRLYLLAECPNPTHERGDSSLPLSGPRTPLEDHIDPLAVHLYPRGRSRSCDESAPSRACSASQDSTSRCTSSTGWPASPTNRIASLTRPSESRFGLPGDAIDLTVGGYQTLTKRRVQPSTDQAQNNGADGSPFRLSARST